MIVYN